MPPPCGDIICQNRVWFQCWPALLNTGAMSGLPLVELDDLVERLALQRLVLLDEAVQRRDIGLVVLVVVQLQRFLAHAVPGQRVLGIGKGGKFEGHGAFSELLGTLRPRRAVARGSPPSGLAIVAGRARQARRGTDAEPAGGAGAPARPGSLPDRAVRAAGAARDAVRAVRVQPRAGARPGGRVAADLALIRLQWWREVVEGARARGTRWRRRCRRRWRAGCWRAATCWR